MSDNNDLRGKIDQAKRRLPGSEFERSPRTRARGTERVRRESDSTRSRQQDGFPPAFIVAVSIVSYVLRSHPTLCYRELSARRLVGVLMGSVFRRSYCACT
jgi:hypothetical protein